MSMKILLSVIALLLLSACNKKEELEIEQKQIEKKTEESILTDSDDEESKPIVVVSKSDTVYILVRSDGAPGMYLGDDGEVHGVYVDLERMVMEKMGQAYSFTPYTDIGPAAQALKTGTHHIALAVPDLPDFQSFLNLSIPYERLNYVTFVRNENSDISGNSKEEILKSLHGKKVGVQTQGHILQVLREIKEIELIEYATTTKAMEALHQGLVDAVPENRETGNYYSELNKWNVKDVGPILHWYLCTSGFSKRFDTSLIERYNSTLKILLEDGSVDKLRDRYYGSVADEYKL